jgi:DNA modification methylase
MVDVFREVRRVLRNDGTVWLNLGDSYAGGATAGSAAALNGKQGTNRGSHARIGPAPEIPSGLKPKDLVGIPWRVAFALQADGWYLRSDIIWSKPNPMPESVTDRPTKAHEYLFLLAKSARYFYDADAVREAAEYGRRSNFRGGGAYLDQSQGQDNGTKPGASSTTSGSDPSAGRNLRSVWTIATAPYPGAHFATFPPKLVEPCVKAGTSERGVCPDCGAPWARETSREEGTDGRPTLGDRERNRGGRTDGLTKLPDGYRVTVTTTGWRPTCGHDGDPVPAVVLDPFAGTGTVGMVAQSLSRRAVLIDLNPDYLVQCLGRNRQVPLGLGS